jgi:hypothetical protein
MDKGDPANPAIPRGLIKGRWRWRKGGGQDTIQRLQALLNNPVSNPSTVDAMLAALYQEERHSPQFDLVSLLVRAGVPLYDRILAAMADASKWGMAVAPLALVALTGRQQETLEGAKRFGFAEVTELLSE